MANERIFAHICSVPPADALLPSHDSLAWREVGKRQQSVRVLTQEISETLRDFRHLPWRGTPGSLKQQHTTRVYTSLACSRKDMRPQCHPHPTADRNCTSFSFLVWSRVHFRAGSGCSRFASRPLVSSRLLLRRLVRVAVSSFQQAGCSVGSAAQPGC